MSKFKAIRSPDELQSFVNEYIANRNLLKGSIQEAKLGAELLEKNIEQFQKPVVDKLDKVAELIPHGLQDVPQNVLNDLVMKFQGRGNLSLNDIVSGVNVDELGSSEKEFIGKLDALPQSIRKELPTTYADDIIKSPLYNTLYDIFGYIL